MLSKIIMWGALTLAASALLFGVWLRIWPNVENGKKLTEQNCGFCHDLTSNQKNKQGPFLWGVVNRVPGSVQYGYSTAFLTAVGDKSFVWDDDHLKLFITNPAAFIPKNRMSSPDASHPKIFKGIESAANRRDIIAYLNTLK
ncbi:MAG: c-type cytochrome [Magnetococcus sp. DMHC-6]